jgi:bifunctional DNA-binding transcriptional regulator/antitoxin component of YhaV-PrlF toxin-antitoxin module
MAIVKLLRDGRVILPVEVLQALRLAEGALLHTEVRNGAVMSASSRSEGGEAPDSRACGESLAGHGIALGRGVGVYGHQGHRSCQA